MQKKKKKTTLTCSTKLTEKKVTTQKKSGFICSRKKENTDLQNWQEEKKHNNENMSEDEHCQDEGDATTGGNLRLIVCGSHRHLLFHIHRPHKIICFARKWDEGRERHSPGSWRESEGFVCDGAGRVQCSTSEAWLCRWGTLHGWGHAAGTSYQLRCAEAPDAPKLFLLKS